MLFVEAIACALHERKGELQMSVAPQGESDVFVSYANGVGPLCPCSRENSGNVRRR